MSRWPLLVAGGSAGRNIPTAWADEPAFTIKATPKEPLRILFADGTVRRPTARAFARLFNVPDTVAVPERLMLAQAMIGNGVPPPLSDVAAGGLLELDEPRGVSLFSGLGLWEMGLPYVRWAAAFELDPVTAGWYERAHGRRCLVADVRKVDFSPWAGVEYLHASPVCKRFSVARAVGLGGERDEDMELALAVVRAVREVSPVVVTVENVPRYARSAAFYALVQGIDDLGYAWDVRDYEAADYGVPHRRRRLILRAVVADKPLAPAASPSGARRSWWSAVRDLEMPVDEAGLAPWQMQRLIDAGIG